MTGPPPTNGTLPTPGHRRWKPLRCGLIELFKYDDQQFFFEDGHLLLRGDNGTGKSRVLALSLPFILDGRTDPARVEPDQDRAKSVAWNLLMGEHPERTGYTWLEFGRLDENKTAVYCTIGCGLRAIQGRAGVETWFFVTGQRVG
ncbi:MAG: TIGR02680 family protein, partial [Planctomycetota bacterium]